MKNKEIELILTKLKIVRDEKEKGAYICDKEHSKLLLSYIEQLENNRDKAIDKIQLLIDIGFDYDGLNKVESLKGLIDELVRIAKEAREILKGDSDE